MKRLITIVEGEGEVDSLPILLAKVLRHLGVHDVVPSPQPIRSPRGRFLHREKERLDKLSLAAAKVGSTGGGILVLLDADDLCPAKEGPRWHCAIQAIVPHVKTAFVLANREYEAWFLASAQALNGHHGFQLRDAELVDAERPRDAKGWMRERISQNRYKPLPDQAKFTRRLDIDQALVGSRSFRKLYAAVGKLCAASEVAGSS